MLNHGVRHRQVWIDAKLWWMTTAEIGDLCASECVWVYILFCSCILLRSAFKHMTSVHIAVWSPSLLYTCVCHLLLDTFVLSIPYQTNDFPPFLLVLQISGPISLPCFNPLVLLLPCAYAPVRGRGWKYLWQLKCFAWELFWGFFFWSEDFSDFKVLTAPSKWFCFLIAANDCWAIKTCASLSLSAVVSKPLQSSFYLFCLIQSGSFGAMKINTLLW